MSATLGTYSIDLVAKIAQFESDLGRAARIAEQQGKAIQDSIKRATDGIKDGFSDIAGKLVAALSVEKLFEFGKQAIETADQIGKMAQKVGVSAESLSALTAQAKLSGISTDDLATGMEKLAKTAAAAAGGSQQQAAAFQAIGVAVKDANGQLRPMENILEDVSKKFASYQDSAAKTALAQELFGKSGANLIPTLNELGDKGLKGVTDQARELGAVISGETAKQAEVFNDNLTKMGIQAHGFANAVVEKLLPSLNSLTGSMVDAGKTTDGYSSSAEGAATAVKGMIFGLLAAKETISGLSTVVFAFFDAAQTVFTAAGQVVAAWADAAAKDIKAAFTLDGKGLDAADAEFKARAIAIGKQVTVAFEGVKAGLTGGVADAVKRATDDYNSLFGAASDAATGTDKVAESARKGVAPIVANAGATEKAAKAAQKIAADTLEMAKILDSLAAKLGGPYDKAWAEYSAAIDQADKAALKYKADGVPLAEIQKFVADATELATERFRELTDEQLNVNRAMEDASGEYAKQVALIGQTADAIAIEAEYQRLLNIALKDMQAVMGPLTEADQKRLESLHGMAAALIEQKNATQLATEAARGWQSIWATAGNAVADTFAKVLVNGGSLFKGLKDLAKQTVEQIIAYFAKLAVINPILNSVFGGQAGYSALPQLAGSLGGGSGGGGIGSLLGGSGGTILGVAGGLFAGYNAFKDSGGGAGGLAAGAAYGVGTYALTGAVTAGVSAAAAGGISAGLAAGFAAIPVVGWIALAAMAINMISGGKLFGTSAKPYGSEQNLSVGAGGADINAFVDSKGQKALFGGSYWKTTPIAVDQQTKDGVAAFFKGLQDAADSEAKAFGETAGTIVAGTFHATYDKAGKLLTQVSTVAGQQFKESIEDFQTRIIADTLLANMGEASAEAQKIAQQWQSTAAGLMAGAQFLSQAALDMSQGHALAAGDTLTQLTALITGLAAPNETLIQTYARLSAEVTLVQGIFTNLGLDTGKTGEALVKFDDDMIKAAGSLDNLNALWNDYYQNFYSDSERAAIKLKNDQGSAAKLGGLIGEDPTESLAKFRADFEAALPTLTAEQIVQWLQFGEALNALSKDAGTVTVDVSKATDAYNAYIAQFDTANIALTQTESALVGVNSSMTDNIAKANELAKAMGLQGASAEDVAKIIAASAQKGADAVRQLEVNAQQLASSLYGSNADQLQGQLDKFKGSDLYILEKLKLQPQIDAAKQQEAAAERLNQASALLADFGQIGAITGKGLGELAGNNVPLDKFAKDLGLDRAGLEKAFTASEAQAHAALDQLGVLTDIRDILSGKTPQLPPVTAAAVPGKPGTRAGVSGTSDVAIAIDNSARQTSDDNAQIIKLLSEVTRLLGQGNNQRNFNPGPRSLTARIGVN